MELTRERVRERAPQHEQEPPAIFAHGMTKRHGDVPAVRGIDLEVRPGEVYAFLGPNGAGKSTVVELLAGLAPRDAGELAVLGADPAAAGGDWRERVGIVLQESQPEPGLRVRECLELYAGYYRQPRDVGETLALVGLEEKAEALGEHLSGGQRRRLDVALALIGDPELIFLDEPTTGFDPAARRAAWSVIAGLRALGKTVFLTTHLMDEAEQLADRIGVIAGGRLVAEGAPRTLGSRDRMAAAISFTLPESGDHASLPPSARRAEPRPGRAVTIRSRTPLADLRDIADWALGQGLDLPDLRVGHPTLEDVYLELTDTGEETRP